ncbi:hypothetical protein OH76DRAFT_1069566 [Lentinus brumalis]|uniref:Uncharacterized protein n=1 Tax=Lentinus brumalis TaxID=2498619 RepID=A0A371DNV5_9APHY|nr:hypothetical protein OH76DRAFT_1069566 [Polyporus brumalis]
MMRRRRSFVRWEPAEATDGNLERRTGVGCTHDGQGQVLRLGVIQESESGSCSELSCSMGSMNSGCLGVGVVGTRRRENSRSTSSMQEQATYHAAPHSGLYWTNVSVHVCAPVARFRSVEGGATPDNVSPQHLRGTHDMISPTRSWFELGTKAAVRVNAQLSRYAVVTAEGVRLATRIQGGCQLLGTLGLDTQCWALAPP